MILSGEYIDATLGVRMGLSTLAAAGVGNLVSDMLGVGCGNFIERLAERLGLPRHGLTAAQLTMPTARAASLAGGMVGVGIGCVVGMAPLLVLDVKRAERLKRRAQKDAALSAVVDEACTYMGADCGAVWIVDEARGELWRGTPSGDAVRTPISLGVAGYVARHGARVSLGVGDGEEWARRHPTFSQETLVDRSSLPVDELKSLLCFPIVGADGEVLGVLQLLNKRSTRGLHRDFGATDEEFALRLCTHIG